jgi:DNA repair protein RadC
MPEQHQSGHRQRLRDRFEKNQSSLEDYELLEMLLGHVIMRRDTKPLAKDLLIRFKSLRSVMDAPIAELQEIKGFGSSLATFWLLMREIKARYAESQLFDKDILINGQSVANMARQRLVGIAHEELWGAYLDNQNRLISWRKLAEGIGGRIFVHNAVVLAPALELKATGIILVHNHPGGEPQPSQADIELTRSVANAAKMVDVRLLDHVIVTDSDYSSLANIGII